MSFASASCGTVCGQAAGQHDRTAKYHVRSEFIVVCQFDASGHVPVDVALQTNPHSVDIFGLVSRKVIPARVGSHFVFLAKLGWNQKAEFEIDTRHGFAAVPHLVEQN